MKPRGVGKMIQICAHWNFGTHSVIRNTTSNNAKKKCLNGRLADWSHQSNWHDSPGCLNGIEESAKLLSLVDHVMKTAWEIIPNALEQVPKGFRTNIFGKQWENAASPRERLDDSLKYRQKKLQYAEKWAKGGTVCTSRCAVPELFIALLIPQRQVPWPAQLILRQQRNLRLHFAGAEVDVNRPVRELCALISDNDIGCGRNDQGSGEWGWRKTHRPNDPRYVCVCVCSLGKNGRKWYLGL